MLKQIHPPLTARETMTESLVRFRQGWEEVAEDERLVDIQASVGLMLSDIVELLDLTQDEQMTVLGANCTCTWMSRTCYLSRCIWSNRNF